MEADEAFAELHSIVNNNMCVVHIKDYSDIKGKTVLFQYKPGKVFNTIADPQSADTKLTCDGYVCFVFFSFWKQGDLTVIPPINIFVKSTFENYVSFGYFSYEGRYFITYTSASKLCGKSIKIISGNSGSSSTVISLPIMKEFIRNLSCTDGHIDIYYNITCKNYSAYSILLSECRHILQEYDIKRSSLSAILQTEIDQFNVYSRAIHFIEVQNNYVSKYNNCHVTYEMMDMMGYANTATTYREMIDRFELPSKILSDYIETAISHHKKKIGYIVGMQYSAFTDFEHFFDDDQLFRTWPSSSVLSFVDECKTNRIQLVNLSALPYEMNDVLDLHFLTLGELYGVIRKMDLVIGIDSICCHIASTLKVPNLSIWKCHEPIITCTPNGSRNMDYSPLFSHNRIICESEHSDAVRPSRLVEQILSILKTSNHT